MTAPDVDMRALSETRPSAESQRLIGEITKAATKLFREKGFLGTTTQQIADAVGLPKATLFYHIGSKEDLLFRVHLELAEEGLRRWRRVAEEHADSRATESIEAMILEHVRMIHDHRDAIGVLNEEIRYLEPERREVVQQHWHEYRGLLENVVAGGIKRKELRSGDAHHLTLAILSMLNNIYRWYAPDGRLGPRKVATVISTLLLEGLSSR